MFGTLVIQGLTMKAIIGWLDLSDDDPVTAEVRAGSTLIYHPLLGSVQSDDSIHARLLREEYQAVVELNASRGRVQPLNEVPGSPLRRMAIAAARRTAIDLRNREVIGEQAYRALVQELDWAELAAGGNLSEYVGEDSVGSRRLKLGLPATTSPLLTRQGVDVFSLAIHSPSGSLS